MNKNNKYFIHESSYVDANVAIGENTKVWHFSHIQTGAQIGDEIITTREKTMMEI